MTITIETPFAAEAAIVRDAAREGVTLEEYVLQAAIEKAAASDNFRSTLTDTYAGVPIADFPVLALFAQWEADDPVADPDDLARRNQEGDEIMESTRRNRAEAQGYADADSWLSESRANANRAVAASPVQKPRA